MTNFSANNLYTHLGAFARPALLTAGLVALTACTSFDGPSQTRESSIPIQTRGASGGSIAGERAYETDDKLFVAGRLDQTLGQDIPAPAHVDVLLIAADGTVVAEERDDIDSSHPRLSRGRNGQIPFVGSFPLGVSREAESIRITYDPKSHASDFARTAQR
jgi:hypothetical protein